MILNNSLRLGCPINPSDGRRWCSTKINPSTGIHVSGQGEYGFCNSYCPNHEICKFPTKFFDVSHIFIKWYIFPDPTTPPATTRPNHDTGKFLTYNYLLK